MDEEHYLKNIYPVIHLGAYLLEYCLLPGILWFITYQPKMGDRKERFHKNGLEFTLIQAVALLSIFIRIISDRKGVTVLSIIPAAGATILFGTWFTLKVVLKNRVGEIRVYLITFILSYVGAVTTVLMLSIHAHFPPWLVTTIAELTGHAEQIVSVWGIIFLILLLATLTTLYVLALLKNYVTLNYLIAQARRCNNFGDPKVALKKAKHIVKISGKRNDSDHRVAWMEGTFIWAQVLWKDNKYVEAEHKMNELIAARNLKRKNLSIYYKFIINLYIFMNTAASLTKAEVLAKENFTGEELEELLTAIKERKPIYTF